MLRVHSPLTHDQEALVTRVMDCAFTVHRALGPGFREKIYERALCLELDDQKISFESQKRILVTYRNWQIPGQTIDLIVAGFVLVEVKAVPKLRAIHRAQVRSYLRTLDLRLGFLMNFNEEVLRNGFRRIVN